MKINWFLGVVVEIVVMVVALPGICGHHRNVIVDALSDLH